MLSQHFNSLKFVPHKLSWILPSQENNWFLAGKSLQQETKKSPVRHLLSKISHSFSYLVKFEAFLWQNQAPTKVQAASDSFEHETTRALDGAFGTISCQVSKIYNISYRKVASTRLSRLVGH